MRVAFEICVYARVDARVYKQLTCLQNTHAGNGEVGDNQEVTIQLAALPQTDDHLKDIASSSPNLAQHQAKKVEDTQCRATSLFDYSRWSFSPNATAWEEMKRRPAYAIPLPFVSDVYFKVKLKA